ncbi:uncharacterized protein [Venturia canescens]|uniref:uncharacterized protein n=1 Tax=Venturia canescens TaxID=32260 RepID=UPI001C9C062C|nr:uncharacterized protein LOC122412604 [Venturia canescens]
MMSFSRLEKVSLIVFVLFTIGIVELIVTDPVDEHQEQPFWQYILREFIFKTMSSPLPDDALYKKIKDAPFYGGSLLPVTNNEDAVLSSGNVFRMLDEQWIFCQDDCEDCGSCGQQRNPIVKWVLKRVKRKTSGDSPKWDLQLTVLPQSDMFFNDGSTASNRSAPSANGALHSFGADAERPSEENNWLGSKTQSTDGADYFGKEREYDEQRWRKYGSRSIPRIKGHRSVRPVRRPGALPLHRSPERVRGEADIRLIVGVDQYGERHLVHMVPGSSLLENRGRLNRAQSPRESTQKVVHSPRVMRTTTGLDSNENAVYNELIDRILDSLASHRNFIETFLFSERLVSRISNEDASPRRFYPEAINRNDRFDGRNDKPPHSAVSSHQISNARPMHSEYQADEQDQQDTGRTDITRKINRPAGLEDQSSLMQYESYDASSNDHQHDERSSLQSDAERRRRNSRIKLTNPFELGNFTRIDDADSVFTANRKLVSNSPDRDPVNTQSGINQTDARIHRFPEETMVRV